MSASFRPPSRRSRDPVAHGARLQDSYCTFLTDCGMPDQRARWMTQAGMRKYSKRFFRFLQCKTRQELGKTLACVQAPARCVKRPTISRCRLADNRATMRPRRLTVIHSDAKNDARPGPGAARAAQDAAG